MPRITSLQQRLRASLRALAGIDDALIAAVPAPPPTPAPVPLVLDRNLAASYLHGDGIEIGALHHPLPTPPTARVRYVDRMSVTDLRIHYPELNNVDLVEVDIIDDGEKLLTIDVDSQDFVIANHFLEHCQDPIATIKNLFRVLKVGGILYVAIPDKRYTFDRDRELTSLDHLIRDHTEGPAWSKRHHFEEWTRLVNKVEDESEAQQQIEHLIAIDYSIHYHNWTQIELLELLVALRHHFRLPFDVELTLRHGIEYIIVLRKNAE
ncbi:MAG: methyltransferase domain-containing protein [Candidatus Viridilinea halotolerans]|uniref:Methyltransferase domain-containing protein n=1 Tax=Candidatus Viridilinea halotolerans TaxID=2491704 RepID=A0A426U0B9_9CHLR|nr:MAG: methyltransferase domain-containing protein [Candidatus Viridilinea halotolerans]